MPKPRQKPRPARQDAPRPTIGTLGDLTPDPANRRAHNPRNLAMLTDALRVVGASRSIVVDEAGVILAGNGVVEAASAAGLTKLQIVDADGDTVVAVRRRGLTDVQKRQLAIYDNRTAELAEWNVEQLAADLQNGEDLTAFFLPDELAGLFSANAAPKAGRTDPDAVPEVRATDIQRGDLFELGAHRLLCGDSTQAGDVARVMGGDTAALCFTSPPYADQRTYTVEAADLAPERLAQFIPATAAFASTLAVNLGIVRRNGHVLRYWDHYIAAAEASELGLLSWNVWSRAGQPIGIGQLTAMFPIEHEWILVFGKTPVDLRPTVPNRAAGQARRAHPPREADGSLSSARRDVVIRDHRELGTVFTLGHVTSNGDHPAQFPVGLPYAYIAAFNGSVLDPFTGAGTTLIAAEQADLTGFGIEIAPSYCQVAIDRWEAFTGQRAVKVGEAVRA